MWRCRFGQDSVQLHAPIFFETRALDSVFNLSERIEIIFTRLGTLGETMHLKAVLPSIQSLINDEYCGHSVGLRVRNRNFHLLLFCKIPQIRFSFEIVSHLRFLGERIMLVCLDHQTSAMSCMV